MNNILNIIRHDMKKVTGSVVAIITIMGLCLVPCCYAWFNILSNWAPYESEATGRIAVAVANMDEGGSAAGLALNVGELVVEGLEANDDIGWVFVEDEKAAIEGVNSGEYYAALVLPEDFTRDVLSFMGGDLDNPVLKYYENEKKNAIAPKITGKAKTAVQEQVNATFVETLAKYISDAASIAEANGLDPVSMLNSLSGDLDGLGRDLQSCIALSESAAGLTVAAGSVLDSSSTLIDSTQQVIMTNDGLLEELEKSIPKASKSSKKLFDTTNNFLDKVDGKLKPINTTNSKLLNVFEDAAFDLYVTVNRDKDVETVNELKADAEKQAAIVSDAGFTALADKLTELADKLGEVADDLNALNTDMTQEESKAALEEVIRDLDAADTLAEEAANQIQTDISDGLADALTNTKNSIASLRKSLASAGSDLDSLNSKLSSYNNALLKLHASVDSTSDDLKALQDGAGALSDILSNAAGNDLLETLSNLLGNDETAVAEYLANPVKMDTEVIWPIENYGSAMAPFYTVLAQWVGALLTAVLIKVKLRRRSDLADVRLHQWYFGRYGLYLLVGVAQAIIVALGDLLYVHIQCLHPLQFVLAAVVNGIVFMMINYALVFALDNIGLGAAVIVLVLQVAGSGGTYPVEVLPGIFKLLYPFMPFRYAMDAMRECIGGMYDGTYWKCLGILGIFFLFAVAFGMALYRPARKLNEMIAESKAKSEIML